MIAGAMRRSTEPLATEPLATGPQAASRRRFALPRRALLAALSAAGCTPRVMPAGPALGPPSDAGEALMMADGVRLPLRSWAPEGEPRGVILALHGFND